MPYRATALLLLTALPTLGFAQDCTDRAECWPEGSAMHTGVLLAEELRTLDEELAVAHKALIEQVGAAPVTDETPQPDGMLTRALRDQQKAWLRYRAGECQLIGALTGAGGSWPSAYATDCELSLGQQRLEDVQAARECINAISEQDRIFEQGECLRDLAPMARDLPIP
ncbi:hypothetical protein SF06_23710 [Pseudomonas flexibilis]|uniref:Uncharacterized conserved protein YecT, DUF1311 family n=1 Tax=Pseudomonas flexibilis TaxID=706570 RepID=A0A1N6U2D1_9PSED|nr:lysozyme inhibitor LprI family protein [Pseudomonas flexibilis]KHL69035.1 hypothetical protein SF06_23710 [Pseudomonas flexibilis]SIQ59730.1 Uncharacterized conserved protein YecT, DUF1311 family [Pseudomonas flexibilis]